MKILNLYNASLFLGIICCLVSCSSQDHPVLTPRNELESQILLMEKQIGELEKGILAKEVASQGQMFDEWHQYAKTLEEIEREEQRLENLYEQLDRLKQERVRYE
ncbi:MAG: hypothetical protein ACSNEK_08510 [Parachlamydiaceae bacterium]